LFLISSAEQGLADWTVSGEDNINQQRS